MNRRNFLASAAAVPAAGLGHSVAAAGAGGRLETEIKRLNLKHTWTTTMSSSEYRDTLHVRYTRGGITGRGEGAPIPRYKEDARSARRAAEILRQVMENEDPFHFTKMGNIFTVGVRGEYAGKAALDIALMDWVGQKLGLPLYKFYGLDPTQAPATSFSIGIDTPEITKQKVREADAYLILKVKVGLATDEATINAVRSATSKPIRVDANEGWKTKEEALEKIQWLQGKGVQLVEQPMPAEAIKETRWLRERVRIPIIADEACQHPRDLVKLKDVYDGVNIKIDKVGGINEAYRMLMMARALGMHTMIGCMVSSSCSITAAAHLASLASYVDLDGNLLISNDPYKGVRVEKGKLVLPPGPGLGLTVA